MDSFTSYKNLNEVNELEEFEVLSVTYLTNKEHPILNVKVRFQNEFISFDYEINSNKQWCFQGKVRVLYDLKGNHRFHHVNFICEKMRNGTLKEFDKKIGELAAEILNHPKVRIKAVLHK